VAGVRVRESRRFREADVVSAGIRRMRPAVAAANAARWARSDRQGKLFLLACVQQRLAPAATVLAAVERLPRSRRRSALLPLGQELVAGVQSLGELDVAEDFRRRGLPEPDRQVVRRRPSGTQYLDCELSSYGLVFEIDGLGHDEPLQRLSDLLRDLTETAGGKTVVRIPLELYGIDRERILDHIEQLLVARGWVRPATAA
jgi:very-short-patch-repair endonuclease